MSGSQSPPAADAAAAARFLAAEHLGGDVHLNAIQRTGAAAGKLIGITIAASDEAAISAWVEKQAQEGRCAYWMPNRPPSGQRQSAKRARFKEDEITTVRWAYLDVDPVGAEASSDVVARVVAKLRTFTLPPTWFVCSGRGVQLLWRLKPANDPHAIGLGIDLRVNDAERRQAAREINFGLITAFGGKAAGVDNCYSLEHLFRVPGSLHNKCKNGSPPLPCFIVHEHSHPEISYEPGEFLRVPPPATQDGERRVADSIGGDPEPVSVARLQEWAKSNGRVIPDKPLAYIATGDAGDFGGDRSDMVYYVAAALDRAGVPPLLIASALFDSGNSISAHIHDAGKSGAWGYAKRQVARARGDNLAQAAEHQAEGLVGFEAFVLDMLDTDGWPSERCVRDYRFVSSGRLLEDAQKWLHRRPGVNHVTFNKIEQAMVGVLGCSKHRISGAENGYLLPDTDDMRRRWDEKRFPWAWKRSALATPSRPEKPPF